MRGVSTRWVDGLVRTLGRPTPLGWSTGGGIGSCRARGFAAQTKGSSRDASSFGSLGVILDREEVALAGRVGVDVYGVRIGAACRPARQRRGRVGLGCARAAGTRSVCQANEGEGSERVGSLGLAECGRWGLKEEGPRVWRGGRTARTGRDEGGSR